MFIIADTGPGIPDDQYDVVFENFGQITKGYKRTHQGAGLGLPIVKRLVELLGGTICLESEPRQGTTFYVSIPISQKPTSSDILALSPERPRHPQKATSDSDQGKILIVEDDHINAFSMEKILIKSGFYVLVANNGLEAINMLNKNRFNAILMDIQMPIMDGVETTIAIRNGKAGKEHVNIPIFAMTAYSMDSDIRAFMSSGMDEYIQKPVSINTVNSLLNKYLQPLQRT